MGMPHSYIRAVAYDAIEIPLCHCQYLRGNWPYSYIYADGIHTGSYGDMRRLVSKNGTIDKLAKENMCKNA